MALTPEAAARALASNDLIALGMEADALRRALHPQNTVTYTVLRSDPIQPERLLDAAAENADDGVVDVVLPAPVIVKDGEDTALAELRTRFPGIGLHGPGATAIAMTAIVQGASIAELLKRLQQDGISSIGPDTDDGNTGPVPFEQVLAVHRASHLLGMPSVATVVMGRGETPEERVRSLDALRRVQEETGGFVACQLCVFHPQGPTARREEEATAADYLTTLAIARLMLESIPHIQAGWDIQGPKVLELALRFGADDAGVIAPRWTARRQPAHHSGEAELRRIIRDAGFAPVARDLLYRQCLLHW